MVAGPFRKGVLGKRVLTQIVKRSPLNLRPLLGIPAGQSAGALAHVVSAYALTRLLPADARRAKV